MPPWYFLADASRSSKANAAGAIETYWEGLSIYSAKMSQIGGGVMIRKRSQQKYLELLQLLDKFE